MNVRNTPQYTANVPEPAPGNADKAAHIALPSPLEYAPAALLSDAQPIGAITRQGQPLPYREDMERCFGRSFADVDAHPDMAAELAPLDAQAITIGRTVAFADAQPSPALVAHEATHLVQNEQASASATMASGGVMSEDSLAEGEADAMADHVAQHGPAVRLPPVKQAPTAAIARSFRTRNSPPPPPRQYSATEWLDHMLGASPLRLDVLNDLTAAKLPTVHPRLTWTAASLHARVWGTIGNAARLQLVLAPLDILPRIDQVREIAESKGQASVGPLTYVAEVAPLIARELETAVDRSAQRLGPRLVAAFDASVGAAGAPAPCDAAIVSPDAIVFSHPLDRIVGGFVREGSFATIRPRRPEDSEPAPDPVAPGRLRRVTYRWAEDPALWNWIHTDPADATPEEVAQQVLGSTARAYELRGSAPFFALPASHVKMIAPDRAAPAAIKVGTTMHQPGSQEAIDELNHGVSETALARSKVGETAALAQAEHATDHASDLVGDTDATALAARCRSQVHLLEDSYAELGARTKLAAMAARLAGRTSRLPTMPAADYARFGKLFAQQSSVLYAVAGDLETIATQAAKLKRTSGAKGIDPRLAAIAELVLEAGACSDLPDTARKQLELAHARHAAIPFDAMDAMLDDARARTIATDALASQWGPGDSGSTKASPPMTGRQQWDDLRVREKQLSSDVLAARRAHDAGTEKPGGARVLTERTRALQIEARVVAAETQCAYMADKLEEEEGVVATIAGQMRDLQRARHGLQDLANTMAGIRIRWREKHAQLFALVGSGAASDTDPATAIRQAIAQLETELAQVGDDKTKAALETAQSELKDMAIARAIADIAIMIGLTLVTSGMGSAAAGAARGLGMGRTAAQLVNVATQSVAMATLRTVLYHDSFSSAFGSELLTNFAGLAALRGVAAGLSKVKLGKSLAILKQGTGAWKYVAHGTELTIEAVTQAGIQFAAAQADSIVRQGRTLNDEELKMLAIQGIGMFVGNAIAHRLANPALDAIGAYAAKIGAPYRRARVRQLAEQVAHTGDPEKSKELIRAERELVTEELALLQQIARDPAERAQFGEKTLATVTEQARGHAVEVTKLGVEHALQHGLDEISPGKAWEGSQSQVEHALAEVRAQGAVVHDEQLADGTRRHTVTAGTNQYTVYELSPQALRVRTRTAELTRAGLTNAQLKALTVDFTDAQLTTLETVMSHKQLAAFYASPDMGKPGLDLLLECAAHPNIHGLKDWVNFESTKKDTSHWTRDLGELREARRATNEEPSDVVNVGGDAHAPTKTGQRSPQGTPLQARSFDLTIADATGAVKRSVEVTSYNRPVVSAGDISEGIAHATTKIADRNTTPVDAPGHISGTPLPIPGAEKDVVIQINLFHGEMDPSTDAKMPASSPPGTMPLPAAGRKSVVFDGLGGYVAYDYAPKRPASAGPPQFPGSSYDGDKNPGNIFDAMLRKLNQGHYAKPNLLKRVRLVGFDGTPIALFEQTSPGAWSRR